MALYQLKSSFAGGELSPSMYGRTDIAKYDSGAAVLPRLPAGSAVPP